MKKFYLHAIGSACYDKTGITFPIKDEINLVKFLQDCGVKITSWRAYPYRNCPRVLSFMCEEDLISNINKQLTASDLPLIVKELV